jgi:integrase
LTGAPLRNSNFTRRTWAPIRTDAGVPWATMHSLRHACSSILVENGADAKTVSERLAHSDVRLTLGGYTHLGARSQKHAASIFDKALKAKSAS